MLEFSSFQQWVDHAASWFVRAKKEFCTNKYICLDNKGRVCMSGGEFMRADREGTFPVKVYSILTKEENT
jgi:hypothetical protein